MGEVALIQEALGSLHGPREDVGNLLAQFLSQRPILTAHE